MTAESLIQDASNRLVDYTAGADAASNAAIVMANQMLNLLGIDLPVWNAGSLPPPGTIDLGTPPTSNLATYTAPDSPGAPPDIKAIMDDAFVNSDMPTRGMVDSAMYAFIAQVAPDYYASLQTLTEALGEVVNSTPISAADSAAFIAQLENGLDDQRRAAQRKAQAAPANGHETGLFLVARMDAIEMGYSDQMARGKTEIAVMLFKITLDMRQFCLVQLNSLTASTRSVFLQYAGIIASLRGFMLNYAIAVGEAALKGYEADLSGYRAEIQAALTVLEASLKRAEGEIQIYKTGLEAKVEAKRFDYVGLETLIKQQAIPYQGELQRNLTQARNELEARGTAVGAYNGMANMRGGIAEALGSGINAIASQTVQE